MAKTYPYLQQAGSMLITYGKALKFLGAVCAISGVIFAVWFKVHSSRMTEDMWPLILVGALVTAVGFWVFGTFIAAIGESMDALADIATNSWGDKGATKSSVGSQGSPNSAPDTNALPSHPGTFELAGALFCENCRVAVTPGVGHKCNA